MSVRDKLFNHCGGRRYADYECPHLGKLRLQSLTEAERMELEFAKLDDSGTFSTAEAAKITARLAVMMIVNDEGKREFTDADVDRLATLDAAIAEPLKEAMQAHAIPPTTKGDAKKNC